MNPVHVVSAPALRAIAVATCGVLSLGACAAPEPTVVVYLSGSPAVADWIQEGFRAAHPEEVLRVEALGGPAVLDSLRVEGGTAEPDVWLGAPTWLLAKAAEEGLLAGTPPSWSSAVPEDMRDPQGRWTGWTADPMVLAFNVDRTSRSRAPRDWIDVFHPRWSEDVLLPDARSSPIMEAFVGTVVAQKSTDAAHDDPGFDWLVRLDANRRMYVSGADELVRRLARGEASLALLALSEAQAAKDAGRPVDFRIPESGSPTLVRGVAAVAGGPHPQGASAFMEWLGRADVRAALAQRTWLLPATSVAVEGEPSWMAELGPLLRLEVVPADTLAAHMSGWLARWHDEVMGRTLLVF